MITQPSELDNTSFFIILIRATTLLTAEAVFTTQKVGHIAVVRNHFGRYHLQVKPVVADQACVTEAWERFYQSLDIKKGATTPWPNRAEAALRLLKAQLKIMLSAPQGAFHYAMSE